MRALVRRPGAVTYIRNPIVSTISKLIIFAFVAFGVIRSIEGYGTGTLRYFTLQSNILVAVASLYLLADGLVRVRAATYVRGIALLAISLTGIVFHALLAPLLATEIGFDSHVLHTVVPVAFVLDWLLFSQKGRFHFAHILLWIVLPLLYLEATLLVAAYYDGFYPYPFMDLATYGYGVVARTCGILLVGSVALGAVYVGADRLLARWGRRR